MAGLFKNDRAFEGGKYLVQRRDGSVPSWPWFVLGGCDPWAPAGLRAYASEAEKGGADPQYVADVRQLAVEYEAHRAEFGRGDPDAPRHRIDDPAIIAKMIGSRGA